MRIQNLDGDHQKMYTLEACIVKAWHPVQLACDGCTEPEPAPEVRHNTFYFSLPIAVLLWLHLDRNKSGTKL